MSRFQKFEQNLNEDFTIIKKWAFQWKVAFKFDPVQQAAEVYFSRKIVGNNPKNFLSTNIELKYPKVISSKA